MEASTQPTDASQPTSSPVPGSPGVATGRIRFLWFAVAVVVLATVAAYSNSLSGPFIFDDLSSIPDNPTIRRLWPIGEALSPPAQGETVSGRPLLNLSLAVNYALGGLQVRGYHTANLAIHVLAALVLLGIVRRTLLLPAMRDRWGSAATPLALAVSLLWALHPLQTESVTYIVQRTESLMGLFYLLTLYCSIRGADSPRAIYWHAASALACLLGMATKEVMVSAPIVVFLYDRTFLSRSFRAAWQRRWGFYLVLAATWLLLGWLVVRTGLLAGAYRPHSAAWEQGAANEQWFTWWSYLLTQPGVILHYLRLAFWPAGLCLDYAWPAARTAGEVVLPAIGVVVLLGLTLWALVKRPAWGFLGACFFLILAPTSSFVPCQGLAAAFEHRMYLPLAAVVSGITVSGWIALCWIVRRRNLSSRASDILGACLAMILAVALGILTFLRNRDYRSDLAIWEDAVRKAPNSVRSRNNLGELLLGRGRVDEALAHFQKALEIKPDNVMSHNNLGAALAARGQIDEAIAQYRAALEIMPHYVNAHNNLGIVLAERGQVDEAIAQYRMALEIKPDFAQVHYNLGRALAGRGQVDEAIAHYRKALEIKPDNTLARINLGNALAGRGQMDEAIAQYQMALEINPDCAEAENNLGFILAARGQVDAAIAHYQKALRIKPDFAEAHNNLAIALAGYPHAGGGQVDEAIAHYQKALEIKPHNAEAHNNLGLALLHQGQVEAAIAHFQKALEIKPDYANARRNLDTARAQRK